MDVFLFSIIAIIIGLALQYFVIKIAVKNALRELNLAKDKPEQSRDSESSNFIS